MPSTDHSTVNRCLATGVNRGVLFSALEERCSQMNYYSNYHIRSIAALLQVSL